MVKGYMTDSLSSSIMSPRPPMSTKISFDLSNVCKETLTVEPYWYVFRRDDVQGDQLFILIQDEIFFPRSFPSPSVICRCLGIVARI